MNIQSVASGAGAYASTAAQGRPTPQNEQAQQSQQAKLAEQARQAEPAQPLVANEEKPRPVTNTQGQTTGSVISVTA